MRMTVELDTSRWYRYIVHKRIEYKMIFYLQSIISSTTVAIPAFPTELVMINFQFFFFISIKALLIYIRIKGMRNYSINHTI